VARAVRDNLVERVTGQRALASTVGGEQGGREGGREGGRKKGKDRGRERGRSHDKVLLHPRFKLFYSQIFNKHPCTPACPLTSRLLLPPCPPL
jgi:hypothetical protein